MALAVGLMFNVACAGESSATGGDDKINIYALEHDQNAEEYLRKFKIQYPDIETEITYFATVSEMDYKLSTEIYGDLAPDIVLFQQGTSLDFHQMVKNNAFKDLTEEINADTTLDKENYLGGTFEAGEVDGGIYALPLTFSIPIIFYDGEDLSENSIIGFDELNTIVSEETDKLASEDDYCSILPWPFIYASSTCFDLLGVKDYSYDEEPIKEFTEFLKKNVYGDYEKFEEVVQQYGQSPFELAEHFTFNFTYCVDFIYQLWGYEATYNTMNAENYNIATIKSFNGDSMNVNAQSYAVLTNNADEEAYEFIRIAMDTNQVTAKGNNQNFFLSVNKNNIDNQINMYNTFSLTQNTEGQALVTSGLSQEISEKARTIIDSITGVIIPNNKLYRDVYWDSFEPYFNSEKSYEDCFTDFENKFNLYIHE